MKSVRALAFLVFPLLATMPVANAQTVTGSMTGTVVDARGALVVGANVLLTNEITKQVREFSTSGNGTFIFPDIFPADYDLKVTQAGFKTYVHNAITVAPLEKVTLP